MNAVCFAPVALLQDPATRPRARQWHAMHLPDGSALVVIDFVDDEARDEFLARPGVEAWADLEINPNAPLTPAQADRLAGATGMAAKMPSAGRPSIGALEDVRRAGWPMARRRF